MRRHWVSAFALAVLIGSAASASAASASAATKTATSANQFSSEALAKAHCPADTVVWANLSSKIFHYSGARSYGKTRHGAYMCEKDASGAGFRGAKGEKHP